MKNNYVHSRKENLITYAQNHSLPIGGSFNYKGEYKHIIKCVDRVSAAELNIISGVDLDIFRKQIVRQGQLHRFAHHLNSSQLLCYNYFRPMMTTECHPNAELIQWVIDNIGVQLSANASCCFEYIEDKEENTNFDFYIKDGNIEIFFEVKYTEYGFGKAKYDKRHKEKFKSIYKHKLEAQKCLPINMSMQSFFDNYQLCRNVCRITSDNKFVVFIFPKNNTTTYKQFEVFRELIQCLHSNVKAIYWENIVDNTSELFEKYFK